MEIDPHIEDARKRLETIHRARAFMDLKESAGWRLIRALQDQWIDIGRSEIRRTTTGDMAETIDALRRWQLACDLVELQDRYIRETIEQANEIRGSIGIDEALLMEQLNEQSKSSGTSGPGPDPAGY